MARKIAVNTLNASTIDILNVIRQNASLQYQNQVPEVQTKNDIPKVGEVIYGTPALANEFINALVNRIALVRIKSATFNNPYRDLKKGYLEFGETIEEVFVNIARVRTFDVEKVDERELKRTLADVRAAFHVINYRVQYPITIQDEDLKQAFLSIDGVQDLIAKIVDSVYTAAEYDEFLLFKYMMIKAISHGKMHPVAINSSADFDENAIAFRGSSNMMTFMKNQYNEAGVLTTTPKENQYIFMGAEFNARFDVKTLASAFNMDKADFMGRLKLIDDWTTFDNTRFEEIRAESDMLEEVTAEELALMQDVVAVLIDEEWFQIYDNNNKMTEKYAASGMYWNYFYNVWKTVSASPFSNAIVFVDSSASITPPNTITVSVLSKDVDADGNIAMSIAAADGVALSNSNILFTQTESMVEAGIGVLPYGALMIPSSAASTSVVLSLVLDGVTYNATSQAWGGKNVGGTATFTKVTTAGSGE